MAIWTCLCLFIDIFQPPPLWMTLPTLKCEFYSFHPFISSSAFMLLSCFRLCYPVLNTFLSGAWGKGLSCFVRFQVFFSRWQLGRGSWYGSFHDAGSIFLDAKQIYLQTYLLSEWKALISLCSVFFLDLFYYRYKKTQETLSQAGQKTSAAFSTVGSAISRKFGDMR